MDTSHNHVKWVNHYINMLMTANIAPPNKKLIKFIIMLNTNAYFKFRNLFINDCSYTYFMYAHAIVKKPGTNFADGITTETLGKPEYKEALRQHKLYCKALEKCGIKVIVLEPDLCYPDGCFVEDTAIITEKRAIITRPGDSTRRGEEKEIAEIISKYKKVSYIKSPGTVDGGDILRIDNHFYIGLSKRTNQIGAKQLSVILLKDGYTSSTIQVECVLHLKTGVTYIGTNTLVVINELSDKFKSFNIIKTDKEENYSANCLQINKFLLVPVGFPKTKQRISELGHKIIEVEMSEFRKMDGGLTCLSLLF